MARRKPKDRFRDWGLYHKAVAAFVVSLIIGVIYRALIVIDGAFEITDERLIHAPAEQVWEFVIDNKNRVRWQGELIEVAGFSIEEGDTRMLSWQRVYDRWRSWETTTDLIPFRVFKTHQEADEEERWFSVDLAPKGKCSTLVKLRELIRPKAYNDRFWFFRVSDVHQKRLAVSLEALDRWTAGRDAKEKSCQSEN